jgi:hypothetical protein
MKKTHYLTAEVQEGNYLSICLPNLPVGKMVEIILIIPETDVSESINRYDFLKLPIEERRRILNQQIETMNAHYQDDTEWQDWVNIAVDSQIINNK